MEVKWLEGKECKFAKGQVADILDYMLTNEELSMALMCVTYWGGTVGSKVSMSGKTGGSSLNIGKLRTSLKESNSIKITFKFIFLLCLLYYCHMAEYNIIHLGQGGHDKNITQWKAIIRKWIDQSTPIDVS